MTLAGGLGSRSGPRLPPWLVVSAMAAVSGALLALSFPPADLSALAWVATVPWMIALARGGSLRAAALSGAVHSGVLHIIACAWMVPLMRHHADMSLPLALLTYGIGALIVLPFGVLPALTLSALSRRIGPWAFLAMAPAWALVDIARARMVLGFPWYVQGMTQARHPNIIGVADIGGVHAVTILVVLGNAAIASMLVFMLHDRARRSSMRAALVAAALVASGLGHGIARRARLAPESAGVLRIVLPDEAGGDGDVVDSAVAPSTDDSASRWRDGGSLTVALIQGAIPQEVVLESRPKEEEARARVQLRLTDAALLADARLIVWSESAYPATFATTWPLRHLQESLARASEGSALPAEAIVGGLADVWPPPGAPRSSYTITNSMLLVDGVGPGGRYDKRYLVPFGEYLPAKWFFFWFKQLTRTVGNLRAGSSDAPLPGRAAAYGGFICYEAVLPQHVRAVSAAGAEVLVNVTNDGWFHGSAVPEQHLRFAILRAVESRKWLLRCANSGISAVIGPDGSVVGRLEEGERGVLLSSVDPRGRLTPYLRLGDLPLTLLGLGVTLAALASELAARGGALPWRQRDG